MKSVVISQPMLFPWVGLLEQVRLADVYVHLDDAQFSKGSFTNRVQIKTASGIKWLTVPLAGLRLGSKILELNAKSDEWRISHLAMLKQAYAKAPYLEDMLDVARSTYAVATDSVSDISTRSLQIVWDYFDLSPRQVLFSSQMNVPGSGSSRVLGLVLAVDGDTYITGHGALQYLDHNMFERSGVRVEYQDYQKMPYAQLHGEFTPFVSSLDLIANCGRDGRAVIRSGTKYWKDVVND